MVDRDAMVSRIVAVTDVYPMLRCDGCCHVLRSRVPVFRLAGQTRIAARRAEHELVFRIVLQWIAYLTEDPE